VAGHGEKLNRKQEQAIAALLVCPTVEAAAAQVNVSYRTLKGWLTLPEFRSAFLAARSEVLDETVTALARHQLQAVETLARNLCCGVAATEVRAATAILEQSVRLRELTELEGRVADLEVAQQQRRAEQGRHNRNGAVR
jgi:hypothetical protein